MSCYPERQRAGLIVCGRRTTRILMGKIKGRGPELLAAAVITLYLVACAPQPPPPQPQEQPTPWRTPGALVPPPGPGYAPAPPPSGGPRAPGFCELLLRSNFPDLYRSAQGSRTQQL